MAQLSPPETVDMGKFTMKNVTLLCIKQM